MKNAIKRAAALASGILVFAGASGFANAETTEPAAVQETTAAETTAETSEEAASAETTVTTTAAETTTSAVTTTAAETTEETVKEEADKDGEEPEVYEIPDWDKADISDYDLSLSLITYTLATPEMSQVNADEMTEEEKKAQEDEKIKKLNSLIELTPTLSRTRTAAVPAGLSEVADQTTGAEITDVPEGRGAPVVDAAPGEFAFVTYGWGHGVGLSQNGANFFATYAGWSYQDILYHYYPGTYLMNTGLTEVEELTIAHEHVGDTLETVSQIVYAEISSSFSYEAIKAQAVAVYTYMKYNNDDSRDMRGKANPPQVVIDACSEVLGEALFYDGNYALTVFSASCGGCSANCYEVFYADYPYLRSASSDYDAAYDPHYGTVTYMSAESVRKKLETAYGITLSDDPGQWIQPVYSDDTGYVTDVIIDGQKSVRGYPFSLTMGLKSSKFEYTYSYE